MSKREPREGEGRPTKYKTEYCHLLIEHMANGLSYEAFAGLIGVSKHSLYEWEKVHEEFSDAKRIAVEKSRLFWEKLGVDHILNVSESFGEGQSKSKSLNASVWIFNMKNRFKWRDKQPDETDVVVNNFANLTDADIDKKLSELKALDGDR